MPTDIGDLVLVHVNRNPAFFARLESVQPDVKPGWYQAKLLVLQVPIRSVVWILRDAYIQGEEFSMGGAPVRLEKVVAPPDESEPEPEAPPPDGGEGKPRARIISLNERRKKS